MYYTHSSRFYSDSDNNNVYIRKQTNGFLTDNISGLQPAVIDNAGRNSKRVKDGQTGLTHLINLTVEENDIYTIAEIYGIFRLYSIDFNANNIQEELQENDILISKPTYDYYNGVYFDSLKYIELDSPSDNQFSNGITIETLFNAMKVRVQDSATIIFDSGQGNNTIITMIYYKFFEGYDRIFKELKNNGSSNEIGVFINKNQWYHLILDMSKDNGNMKIYLD